ncbi:MAG TPA: response regulator [Balneolales bacterium]|nr:response regulator [Balneolales bacterium]
MPDPDKKILIVEDNMLLSLVYERHIENLGYQILDKLVDGEKAVEIVRDQEPDLIIMDIILEGRIDGIEAMRKIREFSDVPVIYITGNSDKTHLDRASETKFIDYLVKPITREDLRLSIEKTWE